jgi:hypothetical protein
MPNYNQGPVNAVSGITPGSSVQDFGSNVTMNNRRLYDFSDRVAELSPEESPFFVYLSQVAKVPTSDSQFRFLEDRTQIAMTDRSFQMASAATIAAQGGTTSIVVDTAGGASVDYLIKGMVLSFQTDSNLDATGAGDATDAHALVQATARIESVSHGASSSTITVKTIQASAGNSNTTAVEDDSKVTVIGTGFGEGSGAPDVFSQKLDDDFGYTQIFKTACEMSNTALATIYRGYADEWARIWNLKLREHKIDIERAMLFGMKGSQGGVQYSDGIAGSIIKSGTANIVNDGSQLSYNEKKSYLKSFQKSEMTYDALLGDFEVIFDPARGGASSKLALASLPVMSHFNKLGDGGFVDASMGSANNGARLANRYNFDKAEGAFGHKVLKVDTIHGDLTLVKEPLFRANYSGYLCLVDLDHVAYRPLVGNGYNRDTSITTNVQQADEDLRKDLILTEAGLEVSLPETHALLHLEDA